MIFCEPALIQIPIINILCNAIFMNNESAAPPYIPKGVKVYFPLRSRNKSQSIILDQRAIVIFDTSLSEFSCTASRFIMLYFYSVNGE